MSPVPAGLTGCGATDVGQIVLLVLMLMGSILYLSSGTHNPLHLLSVFDDDVESQGYSRA